MKVLVYSMNKIDNVITGEDITVYSDFSVNVDGVSYPSTNTPIVVPESVKLKSDFRGFDSNENYPSHFQMLSREEQLEQLKKMDYNGIIIDDELLSHNIVEQLQVGKLNPDFDADELSKEELQQMVKNLQADNESVMRALADLMDMVMGGY